MTVGSLRGWLLEHPVLRNLTPSHLALVTGCAEGREIPDGERVFREGDAAREVFLVRRGRIVMEAQAATPGPPPTATVSAGDALAWAWLMSDYSWPAEGRAAERTEVIVLDAGCLRRKCQAVPALGYDLAKRFFLATRAEHVAMRDR